MDKIYVFTDANKHKIACVVYDEDLKKIFSASTAAKYDDITINEYDAIRFALKKIKKNDEISLSLTDDIVLCIDNTNAKKALDNNIYERSTPPDKDRMDMTSSTVEKITKKIKKHIKDLVSEDFESIGINTIYSPSVHDRTIYEIEKLFLQNNANKIIEDYYSLSKKKKSKFMKFLMKGNMKVDSLTR